MNFQQPQARTARQLMDDVLTLNGIPLGWNIDWGLTDWNVPAGVFVKQGTWIEALVAIASAVGGYLIRTHLTRASACATGIRSHRGSGTRSRQTSCCPSMRWPASRCAG